MNRAQREQRMLQLMDEAVLNKPRDAVALVDFICGVVTIACFIAIGVMLAWRG